MEFKFTRCSVFFFSADRIKIEQNAEPSFSTSFIQELFENQNEATTKKKKERKTGGDENQNNWNWDDLN